MIALFYVIESFVTKEHRYGVRYYFTRVSIQWIIEKHTADIHYV